MAALYARRTSQNSQQGKTRRAIKIPAWAIARRLSKQQIMTESPDSLAKKTVSTDVVDMDDDSLALPLPSSLSMDGKNTTTTTACPKVASAPAASREDDDDDASTTSHHSVQAKTLLFRIEITGFRPADLHLEVDLTSKKLCLAGKGPRMFKRSFPLPDDCDEDQMEAAVVVDDATGKKYVTVSSALKKTTTAGNVADKDDQEDDSSIESVDSQATHQRRSIVIQDHSLPPTMIAFSMPNTT